MNLFFDDGHLTNDGIQAIVSGTLDEMQRLEAAEHLSFCDDCLVRYTNSLADETLMTPPQPLCQPVLRRLRKKAALIVFNKYTTVAAAAALAVVLWATGVFTAPLHSERPVPPPAPTSQGLSLNSWMNQTVAGISEKLHAFWQQSQTTAPTDEPRGTPDPTARIPDEGRQDGETMSPTINSSSSAT